MDERERLAAILHDTLPHNGRGGADEALARMSCEQSRHGRCYSWAASLLRAGVSPSTGEERLDVERLAVSVHVVTHGALSFVGMAVDMECRGWAEAIAREYAALTPTGDTEPHR